MLHHDQGVAQIPQLQQGGQQAVVVALVQADARFIQHVQHPREARPDLGGQPDPLGFPAREGHGRPIQAQIIQPHIQQEAKPQPDLPQHQLADLDLAGAEQGLTGLARAHPHQGLDAPQGFIHPHGRELMDPIGAHAHGQGLGPQPQPLAGGTRHQLQEFLQLLPNRLPARIPQLPLQDRQHPLKGPEKALALAIAAVSLNRDRLPAAVQQHIPLLVAELVPRRLELEAEGFPHAEE